MRHIPRMQPDLKFLHLQLKISFSVHRDLNVKGQNDKSMDYTLAQQPAGAPPMAFPPAPAGAPLGAAPPGLPPAPAPANGAAPFGKLTALST